MHRVLWRLLRLWSDLDRLRSNRHSLPDIGLLLERGSNLGRIAEVRLVQSRLFVVLLELFDVLELAHAQQTAESRRVAVRQVVLGLDVIVRTLRGPVRRLRTTNGLRCAPLRVRGCVDRVRDLCRAVCVRGEGGRQAHEFDVLASTDEVPCLPIE